MPWLKRAALALILACVCVSALPTASAAPPRVVATGSLTIPVPIAALTLETGPDAGPTAPASSLIGPHCDRAYYSADTSGHWFTFREGNDTAGCLGVRYRLDLPDGATSFNLTFAANRSVIAGNEFGQPPAMEQTVRLLVNGQQSLQAPYEVWPPGTGTRGTATVLPITFQVPAGGSNLQLEWSFRDLGSDLLGGPARRERFSATVWDPVVAVDGIFLGTPQVTVASRQPDETAYVVAATVPSGFLGEAAAGQLALSVAIDVDSFLRLDHVTAPDGQPVVVEYSSVDSGAGSRTIVRIPAQTLRDRGAGPYEIHVAVAAVLERNVAFEWLSYGMLAAPPAAIALAWLGLRRTDLDRKKEDS